MEPGARSIYRTIAVMNGLARHPEGVSLSDLARALDLPVSTVHRILQALVETGMARRLEGPPKHYAIGSGVLGLALCSPLTRHLLDAAEPILQDLAARAREAVFFSTRSDHDLLYLHRFASSEAPPMYGHPGDRGPLHASSQGKALLAFLDDGERRSVVTGLRFTPYTDQTITTARPFLTELNRVAGRGFAVVFEEHEPGIQAISAPVLDEAGHPIAAVCLAGAAERMDLEHRQAGLSRLVQEAANNIRREMRTRGAA